MSGKAKLELDGKSYELPVVVGKEGEKAIDISKLRQQSGYVTIDNGYMNTGACYSSITFLDGEKGILRYRGYPIEQLAEQSNFMEVAYLLLNGNLPSGPNLHSFNKKIQQDYVLPDGIQRLVGLLPKETHPMATLSAALVAMSGYYPQYAGSDLEIHQIDEVIMLLLAQMKNLVPTIYRLGHNKSVIPNDKNLNYCSDFLNMMFGDGVRPDVDPDVEQALDILLMLHADHEQNCSTSTVRMVGSSKANIFASISAGVDALWGPSHGGANQAVIEMLEMIKKDGGNFKKFIQKAKDKNDNFVLMGFGHRVYKNFDPRAKIIKKACDTVLQKLGINDPILDIAKGLEEEALRDSYFVEKKLYPNVDFYSGIIYKALGIPEDLFTVMFALGRMPGWLAQWREMMLDEEHMKIGRPRQIYMGELNRDYVPLAKR